MSDHARDVFISYAREDREQASRLADALVARGWSVWWDPLIRSGQHFDRSIEQALGGSRCALVLWSRHSVDSDWVRAEAGYAKDKGKLIPAFLEAGIEPPLQFRQMHTAAIDAWAASGDTGALAPLFDDIEAFIGLGQVQGGGAVAAARLVEGGPPDAAPSAAANEGDGSGRPPAAASADTPGSRGLPTAQPAPQAARAGVSAAGPGFGVLLGVVAAAALAAQHGQVASIIMLSRQGMQSMLLALMHVPWATWVMVGVVAWVARDGARALPLAVALAMAGVAALVPAALVDAPVPVVAASALGSAAVMAVFMLALDAAVRGGTASRRGLRAGALVAVLWMAPGLREQLAGMGASGTLSLAPALATAVACLAGAAWMGWAGRRAEAVAGPEAVAAAMVPAPGYWRIVAGAAIVSLAFDAFNAGLTRHLGGTRGLAPAEIALAYTLAAAAGVAGALLTGWALDRHGPRRPVLVAVPALVGLAWVAIHVPAAASIAAVGLTGAALAAWMSVAYLLAARQARAARTLWPIALMIVAFGVGRVAGGALGGVLADVLGTAATAWAASMALLALPLVLPVLPGRRAPTPPAARV